MIYKSKKVRKKQSSSEEIFDDLKPKEPEKPQRKIQKLDQTVIDRIAAGEVVQRPASALKEMLENCFDAGAKTINIRVKNGGISLLEISDDGGGISVLEDLELVCHRHTASKLSKYEDLRSIQTFGFRGEALVAISRVSKVKIISKTKNQDVAYSVEYDTNGNMVPKMLTPCAGNIGTIIKVEELFYNDKHRREYLSKENEEFRRMKKYYRLQTTPKYCKHTENSNLTEMFSYTTNVQKQWINNFSQIIATIAYRKGLIARFVPIADHDTVLK